MSKVVHITANEVAEAKRLRADGLSWAAIGKRMDRDPRSIKKMVGGLAGHVLSAEPAVLPKPCPEAGGPGLPKPLSTPLVPFVVDTPGTWGILGDTHLPMHDERTIEAFVAEARDRNAVGIHLNGDILDMMGVSPFYRPFTRTRLVDEFELADQFFSYLRARFPKARIIYKEGNHEFRFVRYLFQNAPALQDLPSLQLPELLHLKKHGIEWVQDKRKVMLGKLATLHGHEFRQGIGNYINPARMAFLRATGTVLVNHHHRSSHHPQANLDGEILSAWSVGCACFRSPEYDPYNQWTHGYAMVEVANDGGFSVHNRMLLKDGRVA